MGYDNQSSGTIFTPNISNRVNEERELIKSVNRIARTLWARNIIEQTLRLGFYGASASIILILLVKFSARLGWIPFSYALIPLALSILLGFLLGLIGKPRLREATLFLDRSLVLQNRLTTLLEHINLGSANPLVKPLFSDTIRYQLQFSPALVYKRFNTKYLFQYVLAGLGIIILWLIPAPYINYVRGDIAREQSERIKNTAQDISQFNKLDQTTQKLINEMESIARAIEAGQIKPEEIIPRLDKLSQQVKAQRRSYEAGQKLFARISLMMGEAPSQDTRAFDPARVKKILKRLQDQINQGRVSVDFLETLRQAIIQAKTTVQDDPTLKQSLEEGINAFPPEADQPRAEETPKANLTAALQKFFKTLGHKNREILDRIQARLDIARKEISQVIKSADIQPTQTTDSSLSRASVHPTASRRPDLFEIPPASALSAEKSAQIKEVIKHREAALNKPYWPPEYDDIIREYFK